jgi:hypothetical protein
MLRSGVGFVKTVYVPFFINYVFLLNFFALVTTLDISRKWLMIVPLKLAVLLPATQITTELDFLLAITQLAISKVTKSTSVESQQLVVSMERTQTIPLSVMSTNQSIPTKSTENHKHKLLWKKLTKLCSTMFLVNYYQNLKKLLLVTSNVYKFTV